MKIGAWFLSGCALAVVVVACGGNTSDNGSAGSGAAGGAGGAAGGTGGASGGGTGGTSGGTGGASGSGTGGASGSGTGGSSGSGTGGSGGSRPPLCELPPESGPCNAAFQRFYFDGASGRCELFQYGGCQGNENNFETLEDCVAACDPGGLTSCERSSDCVVSSPGCCGACEPMTMEQLAARNTRYEGVPACPGVGCGPCEIYDGLPERPHFGARCNAGECELFDVRDTDFVACNVDADCRLRDGLGCCEGCTGEAWVAVGPGGDFCPDGPQPCPRCAAIPPTDRRAVCDAGTCRTVR